MSDELFSAEAVAMDSPRLQWVKRLSLQVWFTPLEGRCESPETGEEIKAWSCCTLGELYRLDPLAVGTGDTEEEACANWAVKHRLPPWD